MTTPTYRFDQIAAEANSNLHRGGRDLDEANIAIIKSAIEKAMSGQRIYGEWGTAVVIPDEAAQPQRSESFAPFFEHCKGKSNAELEALIEQPPSTDAKPPSQYNCGYAAYEPKSARAAHKAALDDLRKELQCTQQALAAAEKEADKYYDRWSKEVIEKLRYKDELAAEREPCGFEKREPFAHASELSKEDYDNLVRDAMRWRHQQANAKTN